MEWPSSPGAAHKFTSAQALMSRCFGRIDEPHAREAIGVNNPPADGVRSPTKFVGQPSELVTRLSPQSDPTSSHRCTRGQTSPLESVLLIRSYCTQEASGVHERIRGGWPDHPSHNPKVVGSNPTPATTAPATIVISGEIGTDRTYWGSVRLVSGWSPDGRMPYWAWPPLLGPGFKSSPSGAAKRNDGYFRKRDVVLSARTLPWVWQVGQ